MGSGQVKSIISPAPLSHWIKGERALKNPPCFNFPVGLFLLEGDPQQAGIRFVSSISVFTLKPC